MAKRSQSSYWCSKFETVSLAAEVTLSSGVLCKVVQGAAAALAQWLGIPWSRVKKRRQRGWSWQEALTPALRSREGFNLP